MLGRQRARHNARGSRDQRQSSSTQCPHRQEQVDPSGTEDTPAGTGDTSEGLENMPRTQRTWNCRSRKSPVLNPASDPPGGSPVEAAVSPGVREEQDVRRASGEPAVSTAPEGQGTAPKRTHAGPVEPDGSRLWRACLKGVIAWSDRRPTKSQSRLLEGSKALTGTLRGWASTEGRTRHPGQRAWRRALGKVLLYQSCVPGSKTAHGTGAKDRPKDTES